MPEILREKVIEQCQQLIQINTSNPPGSEREAAAFCESILSNIGFDTQLISHTDQRASLVAMLEGQPEADTFLFVGHLDTVPPGDINVWEHDPHSGFCDGISITGRGASDMKGGLTALLQAAQALKDKKVKNTIIIALTADEESGCLGSNALLNVPQIRKSKLVIIPEPTANQIGIAEKGALWVKITAKGKSAHGSMPDKGINAIEEILTLTNKLDFSTCAKEQHKYLGTFTHSLNTISGGIKTNIIPENCEITIDMRSLPSQNHNHILQNMKKNIQEIMKNNRNFSYQVETLVNKPGIETDCNHAHIARIIDTIKGHKKDSQKIGLNYYTDGAVLIPALDVPFLIFGPGDPGQAHTPNEKLDVNKLMQSCEIYSEIMQNMAFD